MSKRYRGKAGGRRWGGTGERRPLPLCGRKGFEGATAVELKISKGKGSGQVALAKCIPLGS